jgi:hypothetical protein
VIGCRRLVTVCAVCCLGEGIPDSWRLRMAVGDFRVAVPRTRGVGIWRSLAKRVVVNCGVGAAAMWCCCIPSDVGWERWRGDGLQVVRTGKAARNTSYWLGAYAARCRLRLIASCRLCLRLAAKASCRVWRSSAAGRWGWSRFPHPAGRQRNNSDRS